jgi:hypothetical protein
MRGLDPRIHRKSLVSLMDCRVEPGSDSLKSKNAARNWVAF